MRAFEHLFLVLELFWNQKTKFVNFMNFRVAVEPKREARKFFAYFMNLMAVLEPKSQPLKKILFFD